MWGEQSNVTKIPVTIMRGGTSKGVYILEKDMPEDRGEWDELLLRMWGVRTRNRLMDLAVLSP